MRYFTWKMDWSSGVGTDPTFDANTEIVRIEPAFATGLLTDSNTLIYCYLLRGEIDTTQFAQWEVTETTVEAMLSAAQILVPAATLVDGVVKFPEPDTIVL